MARTTKTRRRSDAWPVIRAPLRRRNAVVMAPNLARDAARGKPPATAGRAFTLVQRETPCLNRALLLQGICRTSRACRGGAFAPPHERPCLDRALLLQGICGTLGGSSGLYLI